MTQNEITQYQAYIQQQIQTASGGGWPTGTGVLGGYSGNILGGQYQQITPAYIPSSYLELVQTSRAAVISRLVEKADRMNWDKLWIEDDLYVAEYKGWKLRLWATVIAKTKTTFYLVISNSKDEITMEHEEEFGYEVGNLGALILKVRKQVAERPYTGLMDMLEGL